MLSDFEPRGSESSPEVPSVSSQAILTCLTPPSDHISISNFILVAQRNLLNFEREAEGRVTLIH